MKKIISLILAAVMTASLCACSSKDDGRANRLEEIKQRGYITVTTEPYFAPNEFIDPAKEGQGQYVGADMELAKYIADSLGVELKIVPLDFTAVLSSVSEGKYDLAISALAYSPARAESMNMSKGYYFDDDTEGYGMLCRVGDEDKYPDVRSMKDAVIAVQAGSVQDSFVMSQIPECKEIKYVDSMTNSFLMVQEGKADLAACFIGNGRLYSEANPTVTIVNGFKFASDESMEGTRIGIRKGEDELTQAVNDIIDEVVKSGVYAQWYDEYSEYARSLGLENN